MDKATVAFVLSASVASFVLGLACAGPFSAPPAPPAAADPRIDALERRLDELAQRLARTEPVAAPVVGATPERTPASVPATTSPELAASIAELRDAIASVARPNVPYTNGPGPTNVAAVSSLLAPATKNGRIDGSDLLMCTLDEVLARLGRPHRADWSSSSPHRTLVYELGDVRLHISLVDGRVVQVGRS